MSTEATSKNQTLPADPMDRARRAGLFGLLILATIGIILSAELLRIHLTVEKDPNHPFACHISEAVDCNAVALSRQAVFLALPVPVWAIMTYFGVLVMGLLGLKAGREPWKNAGDYSLPVALWSTAYSGYLAYVSAFELKTFCAYCAGLYVVNAGLLVSSIYAARPLRGFFPRRAVDLNWLGGDVKRVGAGLLIFIFGLIVLTVLFTRSTGPDEPEITGVRIDISKDPMLGFYRAPITVIEFSDYECPACRHMHKTVRPLMEKYNGRVRLFHKNYPLDSKCNPDMSWEMHPRACDAAAAAECAHQLGRFESYAERLWTARDLSEESLLQMAEEEGLNRKAFRQCMSSRETKMAILADIEAGDRLGVEATPTFIINGYKFTGYRDLKWCSRLIEKFLNKEPIPPSGEPVGR